MIRVNHLIPVTVLLAALTPFSSAQDPENDRRKLRVMSRASVISSSQDAVTAALDGGETAMTKKDYRRAESQFRTACFLLPDVPGLHGHLARALALQGKSREALTEYRRFATRSSRGRSSNEEDAREFVVYGDLAASLSSEAEARKAYSEAVARLRRLGDRKDPRPFARNTSTRSLKAAAYTASALTRLGEGDDEGAYRDMAVAVEADSGSWLTRFYHARTLRRTNRMAQARREYVAARRLASGEGAKTLDREAARFPEIL